MSSLIRMIAGTLMRAGIYRYLRKIPTPVLIILAIGGGLVYMVLS